ncbi:MAG: DUF1178 family protein [Rhodoferax sp.]|jgi:hypothetical protein|uniref:DUF1178 family protein n=1 Tax=Rhodoferax sp. TaxID=50421 RepID=UPI001B6704EB|nr:DUF1178 family protein [Rhodoferax sp.]MBP9149038.1 DUF1178 family protein [Rhodoferax sp.]MBP9735809.1 DUF1178 family protein [Rhodoferax sp.]
MIVYDLQCGSSHVFEGWFESDDDFQSQCASRKLTCPLCGDDDISKRLSAPRLNFGNHKERDSTGTDLAAGPELEQMAAQKLWLDVAKQIVATTDDVGDQFATEARRMHYGESPERGIRGKASSVDAIALLEEGIAVLPFSLPDTLKNTLQ